MAYAVGSGLKAASALNTPSCYVQTGGTGTSMTGAGHYKVTVGGDPAKAGLTVDQVAKKTMYFGSIFGKRTSMDDFLNVKGPRLGDAGKMVPIKKDTAQPTPTLNTAAPHHHTAPAPAPASPSIQQRPMLFGRNPTILSNRVAQVGGNNNGGQHFEEECENGGDLIESESDEYSDDEEFEEDEALVAPEKSQRCVPTVSKPHFRELDSEKQQALVQEAFAYIESISGGNRRGGKKSQGGKRKGKKKSTKSHHPLSRPGGAKKRASRPGYTRQHHPVQRKRNSKKSSNQNSSSYEKQQENNIVNTSKILPQWGGRKNIQSSILSDASNGQRKEQKKLTEKEINELRKNLEEGLEIERLKNELQKTSVKNTYDFIANIKNELNI